MAVSSLNLIDSYQVLEVPRGASLSEAKLSYRDLVRVWHPDRFQSDDRLRRRCEEKVKLLNEAFRILEQTLGQEPEAPAPASPRAAQTSPAAAPAPEPQLYRGKWGYADHNGTFRIAPAYDSAQAFSEGFGAVSQGGAFGYVSQSGELSIELRFSAAQRFSEGLALVRFGRCGYINTKGEWVIRPRFDAGLEFYAGVTGVKLDGKWGLIDTYGKWLVLPRFDEMQSFESGRALAREASRSFAVYPSGEVRPL